MPVSHLDPLADAVRDFLSCWDAGSYIVPGEQPESYALARLREALAEDRRSRAAYAQPFMPPIADDQIHFPEQREAA